MALEIPGGPFFFPREHTERPTQTDGPYFLTSGARLVPTATRKDGGKITKKSNIRAKVLGGTRNIRQRRQKGSECIRSRSVEELLEILRNLFESKRTPDSETGYGA